MRIILIVLLALHGFIHLMGFAKAFRLAKFDDLTMEISRISGVIWLITTLIYLTTIILINTNFYYWWVGGFIGGMISQFLIIKFWADAKWGTIANILIFILLVIV